MWGGGELRAPAAGAHWGVLAPPPPQDMSAWVRELAWAVVRSWADGILGPHWPRVESAWIGR